jgi:hypothetical protein
MAQRIRLPFIVDVVLVSDPAEIRAVNEAQAIDRNFVRRGPLINRLIVGRIRRWFEIMGQLLPSLTPRGDGARAARQKELAARLDPSAGLPLWTDAQVATLAAYVRGAATADDASIMTQQIVGNLFDPRYRADRATWQAAQMIDRFRDGFSPIQIVWQLTGRLARARSLLVERASKDRWCMHGTAIGVHGIVQALVRMRELRAAPSPASLGEDAVLALCLAPPRQVPRSVEVPFETPMVDGGLSAGTVLMLQLAKAGPQAPDPEMVFMHGHWNACPARAFVTGLLLAVWRRSLEGAQRA